VARIAGLEFCQILKRKSKGVRHFCSFLSNFHLRDFQISIHKLGFIRFLSPRNENDQKFYFLAEPTGKARQRSSIAKQIW